MKLVRFTLIPRWFMKIITALKNCHNIEELEELLKNSDFKAVIGTFGGRRVVASQKNMSGDISISDLSRCLVRVCNENKISMGDEKAKAIVEKIKALDDDGNTLLKTKNIMVRFCTFLKRTFGGRFDRDLFDMQTKPEDPMIKWIKGSSKSRRFVSELLPETDRILNTILREQDESKLENYKNQLEDAMRDDLAVCASRISNLRYSAQELPSILSELTSLMS